MTIRVTRKPANAYQHGNLQQALVQAGLKLLSERGVEGLSLRAAAQLAGVSHAAPYRHFKDKDALMAAIAVQGFHLLTASMRGQADKLGDVPAPARLRALGRGYLEFAMQHPAYLRVIFGGVLDKRVTTPELNAAGSEAYGLLRSCVADGIAQGQLRQGDADTLALAAWSMVHGLAHLLVNCAVEAPGGPAGVEPLVETLLALLEQGLIAPPRHADGAV